jgi:exoribonuclease R
VIQSTAKLAYESVREGDLPADFAELARRIHAAENRRGAERVDPPEQEVAAVDGGFELVFRPRLKSEEHNAALSLAANMAVADALHASRTGLFRVMAEPDERAVKRLRHTARAFGLAWPETATLAQFERTLDPVDPPQAAFMLAIRRAGNGASYQPWREGAPPWHAAMAATYAHATAPLRRLADRYVVQATLAIANAQPVPDSVEQAFEKLPAVMARADGLAGQIERAVVDLAETVMLADGQGHEFQAIVTDKDDRGARIQLRDLPVVARVGAHNVAPGDEIRVRLTAVDPIRRTIVFQRMA